MSASISFVIFVILSIGLVKSQLRGNELEQVYGELNSTMERMNGTEEVSEIAQMFFDYFNRIYKSGIELQGKFNWFMYYGGKRVQNVLAPAEYYVFYNDTIDNGGRLVSRLFEPSTLIVAAQSAVTSADAKLPIIMIVWKPGKMHSWELRQLTIIFSSMGFYTYAVELVGSEEQCREGPVCNVGGDESSRFLADRPGLAQRRLKLALKALENYETSVFSLKSFDTKKVVAVGIDEGGVFALDMARTGVQEVVAVATVTSDLSPLKGGQQTQKTNAQILAIQTYNQTKQQDIQNVRNFQQEMTELGADWRLKMLGDEWQEEDYYGEFMNRISRENKMRVFSELLMFSIRATGIFPM